MFACARVSRGVVLLSLLLSVLAPPTRAASLCTRCETSELHALKRYYGTLQVDAVTFRGFVANLLRTMETMPKLAPLRAEIMELVRRYDDCVRTCEIPFTKRGKEEDDDAVSLDLWMGQKPAAPRKEPTLLDLIMQRKEQRPSGGDSINILISPDSAANWIRERLADIAQQRTSNHR